MRFHEQFQIAGIPAWQQLAEVSINDTWGGVEEKRRC